MSALPKEDLLYTYADYKEWELDEGERFELIYGEAYAMAAPNARHQEILGELFSQFHVYLRGKPCKVYPAPYDVRLFLNKTKAMILWYSRIFPLSAMKTDADTKAAGALPIW